MTFDINKTNKHILYYLDNTYKDYTYILSIWIRFHNLELGLGGVYKWRHLQGGEGGSAKRWH